MVKLRTTLTCFLAAVFTCLSGSDSNSSQTAFAANNLIRSPSRTLVVTSEIDFSPFSFVSENGNIDGFSIELMRAIAVEMNLDIRYEMGPWNKNRSRLVNGETDAIPVMAYSVKRDEVVDFTNSYITVYDAIFTRTGSELIKSEADLGGKKIIVLSSDLAHEYFEEIEKKLKISLVPVDNLSDAFKLLSGGEGDALITQRETGTMVLLDTKIRNVSLVDRPLITAYSRHYAIAVREGDHQLKAVLNEGLERVRASGKFRELYEKWLGSLDPLRLQEQKRSARTRHLMLGFALAILVASVALGFVFVFRREVFRQAKKLSESESRFQGLVANLPGAVFSFELREGEIGFKYLSDGILQITGYSADEFIGTCLQRPGEIVHADDLSMVKQSLHEGLRMKTKSDFDFRLISKFGDTRWVHARAASTMSAGNRVVSFDGILLDITEAKLVSDMLAQQQASMATSSRLSALGEMAAGVAHEVNNPLTIIGLRSHQLMRIAEKGPVSNEDALSISSSIEATTHRISRIIKSLKAVARESKNDPFEEVSLKTLFDETFELCYQRMISKGIEVIMDVFPDELKIECRRVQIAQVLINLLNNAFDAVADQEQRFIRVSVRDCHRKVEISIVDSGPGIPTDIQERVFQPFFTTKELGKGTGLGLSISKGLVEAHKGELWLDQTGSNTRFVMVLPKRQQLAKSQATHSTTPVSNPPGSAPRTSN